MSGETILPTGTELVIPPDLGLGDLVVTLLTEDEDPEETISLIKSYTGKKGGADVVGRDIERDICKLIPDYPYYLVFNLKRGNEIVGAGDVEVVKITDVIYYKSAIEYCKKTIKGFDTSKLNGEQIGMLYYITAKEHDDIEMLSKVCRVGDFLTRAMAQDMDDPKRYIATYTEVRGNEVDAAKEAGYEVHIPTKDWDAPSMNPKYKGPITDLCLMANDIEYLEKQPKWLQKAALYAQRQRVNYRKRIKTYFEKACLALDK